MKNFRRFSAGALALGFVLGTYRGYVALWEDGYPDPRQIYPCPVVSLPLADQAALEEGVRARSRMELELLLEDYLS